MFLGIIASVPLIQMLIEARQEDGVRAFEVFSQAPTAANLRAYERSMEAANWAARVSRPWIQFAQFAWLKDGGEKGRHRLRGMVFLQTRAELHAGSTQECEGGQHH